MIIRIIFGIICILAGLSTSAVAIYGLYDSMRTKDKGGAVFSIVLMLVCSVTIIGGIGFCIGG